MIYTFGEQVQIVAANNFNTAIVDGKFPASTAFRDVSDMERFAFLIKAGTLDSALTCKVQQADAADGTPKDVTGATVTVGALDDNDTYLIEVETRRLDITNKYHFVTLDVAGAAGSNDYLAIIFLGLNAGKAPVTQDATTNTVLVAG